MRSLAIVRALLTFAPLLAAQDEHVHSLTALLENGFVRIPAGEFLMGSRAGNPDEQPVHRVRISTPFEMSKYEVTQAQWDTVMRNPHSKDPGAKDVNPSHFKGPSKPVENVSWVAVQQFLRTLNQRDPKHMYRLPTEAEWEYAARAGSTDEAPPDLDSVAWYAGNSGEQTHPIGQKKPNAWGLHDIFGNVLEWVQDWYAPYRVEDITDPEVVATGSYKVYRGCGWLSEAKYCRPAFRGFDFPSQGQYSIGFRLVRLPKQPPAPAAAILRLRIATP